MSFFPSQQLAIPVQETSSVNRLTISLSLENRWERANRVRRYERAERYQQNPDWVLRELEEYVCDVIEFVLSCESDFTPDPDMRIYPRSNCFELDGRSYRLTAVEVKK